MAGADRSALLPAVLRATAVATGVDQLLQAVTALLADGLADWVLADRLADPDLVVRAAAVGPDGPLDLPSVSGPARSRRSSASAGGLIARLRAAPLPIIRLSPTDLEALRAAPDPRLRAQAELALALGTVDALVIGTLAHGRLNGVLSVGRTATPFSRADRELLDLVALHVGTALDAASLRAAQRDVSAAMQRTLLPPLPLVAGLDLAARYQASARGLEVGGDWYDAFALPDGALALVIGDATGHDTGAIVRMAGLRHRLRALAVDRCEQPAATLARLDHVGGVLDGDTSGTCIFARLVRDAGGWELSWSSAGHLPPVLVRGGTATLAETPPDLMLGVDAGTARADHAVRLLPGDLLVFCTDGLVEQRRVSLDERLEQLRAMVQGRAGVHPEVLADALLDEFAVGADDDVALLLVRIAA